MLLATAGGYFLPGVGRTMVPPVEVARKRVFCRPPCEAACRLEIDQPGCLPRGKVVKFSRPRKLRRTKSNDEEGFSSSVFKVQVQDCLQKVSKIGGGSRAGRPEEGARPAGPLPNRAGQTGRPGKQSYKEGGDSLSRDPPPKHGRTRPLSPLYDQKKIEGHGQ